MKIVGMCKFFLIDSLLSVVRFTFSIDRFILVNRSVYFSESIIMWPVYCLKDELVWCLESITEEERMRNRAITENRII